MKLDLSQISSGIEPIRHIPIGKKIGILVFVFLLALSIVEIGGVWGLRQVSQVYALGHQQLRASQSILRAARASQGVRRLVSWALATVESETGGGMEKALQDVGALSQDLKAALDTVEQASLQAASQKTFEQLQTAVIPYVNQAENLIELVAAGQQLPSHVEILMFQEMFTALSEDLATLEGLLEEEVRASTQQGEQAWAGAERLLLVSTIIAACLSCGLGWFLLTTISTPLARLSRVASRLATGDLQQQIDYNSADEVGTLAAALRELLHYLRGLAQATERIGHNDLSVQIRPRSEHDMLSRHVLHLQETLRTKQSSLQSGSDSLADSLKQMARSVTQLSTSSAETSTSITESATTVEQVRQSAQLSVLKAKEVATHSQQAAVISQSGEQSVEEARRGILEMRAHVESIAESVATLDEQSQAIGDIIMSVNDLAEQSHVLAVNAAIEAAKAGESGRGFGVVAQEVKTLAEESQKATTQVYAILHDVQQAVAAAMEATQQGTASVEIGVKKSIGAGELLRILSQNIAETGQAVTQIATNSEQQLIGVDQMVLAVDHIKSAAGLHVNGLEQIEQAIQNVQAVGQSFQNLLTQLVDSPVGYGPSATGSILPGEEADTWNPNTRLASV